MNGDVRRSLVKRLNPPPHSLLVKGLGTAAFEMRARQLGSVPNPAANPNPELYLREVELVVVEGMAFSMCCSNILYHKCVPGIIIPT